MSQKRKRPEQNEAQGPDAKRPFRPGGKGLHKFKPKRHAQPDDEQKTASLSALKSRIRNLRRLLEHVESAEKHKMPAGVRIERERELEACQHELAEKTAAAQEAQRRNHLISKYHHVRFFGKSFWSSSLWFCACNPANELQSARKPQGYSRS